MSNESKSNTPCKGLLFRGVVSKYFDKKAMSFNYKETFRLLKRSSCCCKDCEYLKETLVKDGDILVDCTYWFITFNHKKMIHGATYKMNVKSWESEWCDYSHSCLGAFPEKIEMKLVEESKE